jgi:hypothetical protein
MEARSGAGVGDRAGVSGTRIRVTRAEQVQTSGHVQPSVRPGASHDRTLEGTYLNVLTSVLQWSYHKFSIRTTVRVSLHKPVYNI